MFDYVRCEFPLPGEPKPEVPDFQTKDFDCFMQRYFIRADRSLWCETGGGVEQVAFDGVFGFYTLEHRRVDEDGIWFEYEVKFKEGALVWIELVEIHKNHIGRPPTMIYRRE